MRAVLWSAFGWAFCLPSVGVEVLVAPSRHRVVKSSIEMQQFKRFRLVGWHWSRKRAHISHLELVGRRLTKKSFCLNDSRVRCIGVVWVDRNVSHA